MSLVWSPGFNGVTDPDAQTYIAAVEAADGQAIEGNVAYAINDFVVGCKTDGIWDAIKASCILAGARTLSGALVPLKGTAPTNNNFVAGDYNRETGLVGGSTKYLNSNRKNNDDPQDNVHNAVYLSSTGTSGTQRWHLASKFDFNVGFNGIYAGNSNELVVQSRTTSSNASNVFSGSGLSTGFIGSSRSTTASYSIKQSGLSSTASFSSRSPTNDYYLVLAGDVLGAFRYNDSRLSFYSIGEAIDLEKLDTRTNQLMNGISYGVSPDADAQAYIQAVETADNRKLEFHVAAAINAFVVGCKADGVWNAIKSSCILAGARTLAGALVPLKGTAPTNYNFVSGDYNRKTGLVGDGSTKYLDSNRNNNADPQNDRHLSVNITSLASNFGQVLMGGYIAAGGSSYLYRDKNASSTPGYKSVLAATSEAFHGSPSLGFFGAKRSTASTNEARHGGTNYSDAISSSSPVSISINVFNLGQSTPSNYTDARLSFYSIGESLDLALLDARVSTLMTDIGAAIP